MRLLITLLLSVITAFVHAEERIHNYHSDIIIDSNGDMKVTETITVNAEGNKIKRGIYRDFPTKYKDRLGNNYKVGFSIDHIMRNDRTEDYHIKNMSNGVRIYLGSKDRYLKKGIHRYTISYRTNRQLGFFDSHDELYWNVTGNDWDFPIDKASASVHLPDQIPSNQINTEAYTGAHGSKGQDYRTAIKEGGAAYIETTRSLPRRHGLTIVISWPKGFVTAPTRSEKIEYLYQDNQYLFYATIGFLILLAYYWLVWSKVGKDPEEGAIFPHYEPPAGYSPASLCYVLNMGYDNACFAAAIINLAVKGFLKIEEDDDEYSLELTGKENIEMAPGEAAIIKKLFEKNTAYDLIANSPLMKKFIEALGGIPIETDTSGKVTKIKLTQKNHERIGGAVSAHKSSLQNNYEKIYFLTNTGYFVIGLVVTLIVLVATIFSQPSSIDPGALFMLVWLTIWTFAVFFLVKQVIQLWSNINGIFSVYHAVFMSLFALPFIAGEIFGLNTFIQLTSFSMGFVLLIAAIINWIFYELLKAPTLAGRKLLDKIEGFKQYIDIAERHDLDFKHPKGRSPELFEEYLPYALALGVEQQWGESFADVLAQAQTSSGGYSPTWYHGTHWNNSNIGNFTSSLGSSFTSAIASSSTAPGSSSGGGGGGSSGGGGGGGGGGGW
ncbi:MAG: DUF2207 domain-containing protein [Gammaproteobacteria bacterium]